MYGYASEDSKVDRHDNPMCGVEEWISTEVSCDHYNIEYKDTCYVMYSHNPCNMSDFDCAIPHYDLSGNWQYTDCKAMFTNYSSWMSMRDHWTWHDITLNEQMPYIHENWDIYHGIEDNEWWYEDWTNDEGTTNSY
jgi:hypothetical protein